MHFFEKWVTLDIDSDCWLVQQQDPHNFTLKSACRQESFWPIRLVFNRRWKIHGRKWENLDWQGRWGIAVKKQKWPQNTKKADSLSFSIVHDRKEITFSSKRTAKLSCIIFCWIRFLLIWLTQHSKGFGRTLTLNKLQIVYDRKKICLFLERGCNFPWKRWLQMF